MSDWVFDELVDFTEEDWERVKKIMDEVPSLRWAKVSYASMPAAEREDNKP